MTTTHPSIRELHMFFAEIDLENDDAKKREKLDRLKTLMDDVEWASQFHSKTAILNKVATLWGCASAVYHDARLVAFAQREYLPAARNYQLEKHQAGVAARETRLRLGRASKLLYQYQKKTFVDAINLIVPVPIPQKYTDTWWMMLSRIEMRVLSRARATKAF